MNIQNIVIIGSGNVATAMGHALKEKGFVIKGVFSRNIQHAKELADALKTGYTDQVTQIPADADLYIIAVKDEAIAELVTQFTTNGLVVHTSGATPVDVLNIHKRRGVFYGLQTFNKNIRTDFSEVPFLIEASSKEDEGLLTELAKKLSSNITVASSAQRQHLHVAAVFANNFTNHLLSIAKHILEANKLSFDLLKPLIEQTIHNALVNDPMQVQTGPAVRHDEQTINMHMGLLEQDSTLQHIYRIITESIRQFHREKL